MAVVAGNTENTPANKIPGRILTMESTSFSVRALLFGQSIEPRQMKQAQVVSRDPTTIAADGGGYIVLFRFGVAVFFNLSAQAETSFLQQMLPLIKDAPTTPSTETLEILLIPDQKDSFEHDRLIMPDASIPRLQVVADILAKSVFLDDSEQRASLALNRIEPLAERMYSGGRLPGRAHDLLRHIGEVMQLQHRMVARAQVGEKPEVLWDHSELENLWHRLENEFEIGERQLALERKLDLISSTAETLLGLLQDRHTLRVEWYIVILIVIEIALTLYELFIRQH
jgi:uncharacterized Rmd1/YagE family protein